MANSISIRTSGLQVPLSRIQSLARATLQTIDEMGAIEDHAQREAISHLTNFADLIFDVAAQASREAEGIEIASRNLEGER